MNAVAYHVPLFVVYDTYRSHGSRSRRLKSAANASHAVRQNRQLQAEERRSVIQLWWFNMITLRANCLQTLQSVQSVQLFKLYMYEHDMYKIFIQLHSTNQMFTC